MAFWSLSKYEIRKKLQKKQDIVFHRVKNVDRNYLYVTDFITDRDDNDFFDSSELAAGILSLGEFCRKAMELSRKYGFHIILDIAGSNNDCSDVISYIAGRKKRYSKLAEEAAKNECYNSALKEMREMRLCSEFSVNAYPHGKTVHILRSSEPEAEAEPPPMAARSVLDRLA